MFRLPSPTFLLVLLCLSAQGCGGAPATSPAATPATVMPVSPPASAPVAASVRRLPPDAMLRYWPFDAPPLAMLYADVGGLLHTELGKQVVPASLALAQSSLSDAEAQCLRGASDAVKEILFGADDRGAGILIARYDDAAFDPLPCLKAEGATPVRLEGAPEALALSDSLLVHLPGLLLVGPEPSMKQALRGQGKAHSLPPDLSLAANEFVTWSATIEQNALHGSLLASNEQFRIGVDANVSEADAQDLEQGFQAVQQKKLQIPGFKGPEAEMLLKILQSVTLTRTGSHLAGALDLHEPPVDQARDLGMMTALSVYGVRQYLLNAKVSEARVTLMKIAAAYGNAWRPAPGQPRGARRLVSFPPVPAVVPKGSKYLSAPVDWKAWQPIGFSLDGPQYYQYEVLAAKDGRSADIIARGDLDADGKQSEFRLHLILKDSVVASPNITEHDPEE
jgi:hypothetical protein